MKSIKVKPGETFDSATNEALMDGMEIKAMMQYILTGKKVFMMLVNASKLVRTLMKALGGGIPVTGLKPDDFICPKGVVIDKEINPGVYQVKLS